MQIQININLGDCGGGMGAESGLELGGRVSWVGAGDCSLSPFGLHLRLLGLLADGLLGHLLPPRLPPPSLGCDFNPALGVVAQAALSPKGFLIDSATHYARSVMQVHFHTCTRHPPAQIARTADCRLCSLWLYGSLLG